MGAKKIVILKSEDYFEIAKELERFAGYCRKVGELKQTATEDLRVSEGFSNFVGGLSKLRNLLAKDLGVYNIPSVTLNKVLDDRVLEYVEAYKAIPRSGKQTELKPAPSPKSPSRARSGSPSVPKTNSRRVSKAKE